MLDWPRIDAAVMAALSDWRRACDALARGEVRDNPLAIRLTHGERIAEIGGYDDPIARAIAAWASALADERAAWDDRVATSRAWGAERRVDFADDLLSARAIRGHALAERLRRKRHLFGGVLVDVAGPIGDRAVAGLERRFEREHNAQVRRFGSVLELSGVTPLEVAEQVLDATDDAAEETMRRGWLDGVHAALGTEASDGWPAQLTVRWVEQAVAATGAHVSAPKPPAILGATSFARALSAYGALRLSAARPKAMAFAWHAHPSSVRRHRRAALFGALIAEEAFCRRVLSLGKSRARDQQRRAAAALLASVRIDALRVVIGEALRQGRGAARERFDELSARMFDEPLPRALLGVLPQLRPADGASLVGSLLSRLDRNALVDDHDEDWFANPQAIARVHDEDTRAVERDAPIDDVGPAIACLVAQLERAL